MVLIEETEVKLELSDLLARTPIQRPKAPPHRSPGVHQSGVLAYIAHSIGILKPDEKDEEDASEYPVLWALGQAWEEFCVSLYPDVDWQPGEETRDGISGSCDGLSFWEDESTTRIEEYKFTFKKVKTGDEFLKDDAMWMWRHQGRAYCKLYGPRVVRWHVCHVRGDYKAFGPVYKRYAVEFSDKEIDQTWSMLCNNRDKAVPEKGN